MRDAVGYRKPTPHWHPLKQPVQTISRVLSLAYGLRLLCTAHQFTTHHEAEPHGVSSECDTDRNQGWHSAYQFETSAVQTCISETVIYTFCIVSRQKKRHFHSTIYLILK